MMYSYAIPIPANTTEGDPVEQDLTLTHGIITHVEVEFPPGCAGLVHLVVTRYGSQLWPLNPDGDLASDGYVIPWDEEYDLTQAPYTLRAVAWNDDDTFAHTLTIRITLSPIAGRTALQEMHYILQTFARLVGIK